MKPLKRVVIKEELVALTGDYRPALILNQFIYWIERMYDTDKYIREEKERASKHEIEINVDESKGWIYKTAEEINEELIVGMSKATIGKYVKQLVDSGYLAKRNNPKYKWDKTLQYRVDLYKVQKDLAKLGYALEGYKLLPGIEILDTDNENIQEDEENKEAPSTAIDEAQNSNNNSNKSIPQDKENNTINKKENMESNPIKSLVLEIIENSCVNIKKADLPKCEEEFTDIDRLKKALEICEENNNNGVKALRLAYRNIGKPNKNSHSKGASHGVNNTFKKYTKKELEEIIQKSQENKFNTAKDNCVQNSLMSEEYFDSLSDLLKGIVSDYILKSSDIKFKPYWITNYKK